MQATSPFIHWQPLVIEGAHGEAPLRPLGPPPADVFTVPESTSGGPSWTLARHYAAFADDILSGRRSVAGFGEAVTRHRLIDRIQQSAGTFFTGAHGDDSI